MELGQRRLGMEKPATVDRLRRAAAALGSAHLLAVTNNFFVGLQLRGGVVVRVPRHVAREWSVPRRIMMSSPDASCVEIGSHAPHATEQSVRLTAGVHECGAGRLRLQRADTAQLLAVCDTALSVGAEKVWRTSLGILKQRAASEASRRTL